ncbi:MAG: hypothetical protein RMN51_08550 [Verrucomicrobiota bacterium]|nr:hypothetical protein [Limisphaera sp.]MDW8382139.1 hypothetical protein [Verrucomicrobiota bacterium]
MRLEYREDPREWRRIALASVVGPALVASFCAWRGWMGTKWWVTLLAVLGAILIAALVRPSWFRGYYRMIVWTGFQVARFLGYAVLTGLFWLVVVPLGVFLRVSGRDLLQLKRDDGAVSYWKPAPPATPLDKMF